MTQKQTFDWTFEDVRVLDRRLAKLENTADDVKEVKESLKTITTAIGEINKELSNRSHVVVDNTDNSKDKIQVYVAVGVSVVFAIIYLLNQLGVFK